ncbi:polyamine-modulated factor 1-like [Argopecten irradians]|uniref:polyamine-modulated factor 1-like n=1 Tax=Argopecten irradians TaxID=31199 RepID=UPI00371DC0F1
MAEEGESMEATNDDSQKTESIGRMQILDKALSQARKKIISSAKLQLFQKHLRPIHKKNPEIIKKMHMLLTKQLDSHISEEVVLMFAEEQMEKILNDLDAIVESQRDNKEKAWRPSGNPQQDSRVYNIAVKLKQKAQLQHVVSQLEQQNSLFRDHVALKQKKLLGTKRTVDSGIKQRRNIKEAAASIPSKEMSEFVQKFGRIG